MSAAAAGHNVGRQFAALGIKTGEFKARESEGGAHRKFTPATGNEIWDEGSYFAGKEKEGGPFPFLDAAVSDEYGRTNPFGPSN